MMNHRRKIGRYIINTICLLSFIIIVVPAESLSQTPQSERDVSERIWLLISKLEDPSSQIRFDAAEELGDIGPAARAAVPALTKVLTSPDHFVGEKAALALSQIGPDAKSAVGTLIQVISERPYLRRSAIVALGQIGVESKPAVPILIEALGDEDDAVRIFAALALGKIGPEARQAVPRLIEAMHDRPNIRSRAMLALAQIGLASVPHLIEALNDLDEDVRRRSAIALGMIGRNAQEAIPALCAALKDKKIKQEVSYALVRIGPNSIPSLLEMLNSKDQDTQRDGAAMLRDIALALRRPTAVKEIDNLNVIYDRFSSHPDPEVKKYAENVKDIVTYLESVLRKDMWRNPSLLFKQHPYLTSLAIGYTSLLCLWFVLLLVYPLALLKINEALKFETKIKASVVEITFPLRYTILVGFFHYRRRVLDKWVAKHIVSARENFSRKNTVEQRNVYVDIPVIIDKESVEIVSAVKLQPLFSKKRSCVLIQGEGGGGKTSLACQIGKWAMEKDKLSRLCLGHLMLPVLIEQNLDLPVKEGKVILLEVIRGQLAVLLGEQEPVSEDLLNQLLRRKRILMIVDGLSELNEDTRKKMRPGSPDFPASALVVTSRINESLDEIPKATIQTILIKGNRLSSFMEAYLTKREKRELFDDPEYFTACTHLSMIVGERDITVLIAKLYAEQMIARKDNSSVNKLPKNIPDLMLSYINEINRRANEEEPDDRTVQRAAKLIASECLKQNYRPTPAKRKDVLAILGGGEKAKSLIKYLEERLQLIQTLGSERDDIHFILDPLAEYLAGLHLVDKYGDDKMRWNEFLSYTDHLENNPEAIRGFLLAVRDCCLARAPEVNVSSEILDELITRAGLNPEKIKAAQLVQRIRRLIINLNAPDPEDRATAVEALGKIGPEAAEAVPTLIEAWKDEDDYLRFLIIDSLVKIDGGKKIILESIIELSKDENEGVREALQDVLSRVLNKDISNQ